MRRLLRSLREHTFVTHLVVLALMALPPALLYAVAQSGTTTLIWPLLGLVVLGNVVVLFTA